jgi:general secretion pathway protein B
MSYILDALRKSEQLRQTTQPDTVTERLLVNPSQSTQTPLKWLSILVLGNLLVMLGVAWFFIHKPVEGPKPSAKVESQPGPSLQPVLSSRTALPDMTTNSSAKAQPGQVAIKEEGQKPPPPSIAQMLEAEKMAEARGESQQPEREITPKKPLPVKKAVPTKIKTPYQKPRLASNPNEKNGTLHSKDFSAPMPGLVDENSNKPPKKLNINVYSYAEKPEDRFVIIDMVKYKPGQLVNGTLKLKEIRADHIVLQDGNAVIKVDRP